MKRIISCILIAAMLICASAAFAQVPTPSDSLFDNISKAMKYLSEGAYDKVVSTLPFSDVSPSADEWRNFAEGNFRTLTGLRPQDKYIVLYWSGSVWKVAMPVHVPERSDVEVLVLSSEDGQTFNGYGCADWGSIRREYEASPYVKWTEEYRVATFAMIEFDD